MHPINFIREQPTAPFDAVVIELVPFRCSGDFWTRELRKRMEDETVNHESRSVGQTEDKKVDKVEHHVRPLRAACGLKKQ